MINFFNVDYSSNVIENITISPDDYIYPLYNTLTSLITEWLNIENVEFLHVRDVITYLYRYPDIGCILLRSLEMIKQNINYSKMIISIDTNCGPTKHSIIVTVRQHEYIHDLMDRIDQISYNIEKSINFNSGYILITSDFVVEEE